MTGKDLNQAELDPFFGVIILPDFHKWLYFYTCLTVPPKKSRFSVFPCEDRRRLLQSTAKIQPVFFHCYHRSRAIPECLNSRRFLKDRLPERKKELLPGETNAPGLNCSTRILSEVTDLLSWLLLRDCRSHFTCDEN